MSCEVTNLANYPETAVRLRVEQLTALGAEPRHLVAKLAGGASMFAPLMTPGAVQMGERNVAAARAVLRLAGIPVMPEGVGGGAGSSVPVFRAACPAASRIVGCRCIGGSSNVASLWS